MIDHITVTLKRHHDVDHRHLERLNEDTDFRNTKVSQIKSLLLDVKRGHWRAASFGAPRDVSLTGSTSSAQMAHEGAEEEREENTAAGWDGVPITGQKRGRGSTSSLSISLRAKKRNVDPVVTPAPEIDQELEYEEESGTASKK